MSDLQGVETGARGYVITGDARYLAPHRAGVAEASGTLRRLRGLARWDARAAARGWTGWRR